MPDYQPPRQPRSRKETEPKMPPIHRVPVGRVRPNRQQPTPASPRSSLPPALAPAALPSTPPLSPESPAPLVAAPGRGRQFQRKSLNFLLQLLQSWKFWVVASLLLTSGSGAFALAVLLRLPGLPNCPAVFWPLASASLRFECARLAADKQTMKDLLEAITLVDSLPSDHPMREEANRLIELWSDDVLDLAEVAFHEGKLKDAIAAAKRIPAKAAASRVVEERIRLWESIWAKAESDYRKAEEKLRKLDWRGAFEYAVRLLDAPNKYWQTTKYEELRKRIELARQDGNKLYKAERLAEEGGLENLLAAIKLAESINKNSYIYQEAQKAIVDYGRKMLVLAQETIDRKSLSQALQILEKVPDKGGLKEEAKDMTILANAQSSAWQDSVAGLEDAIAEAQRIASNRPLYKKAQQLISRWQLEIEAVAQLEKARGLAASGSPADLSAAIALASQIPDSNPRKAEAEKDIQAWSGQIQTQQDRPLLDQADQIASAGDANSLQAAINQASQIGQGRALYGEARDKILQWSEQIQRIQDQPILDRARTYASAGNLPAAIDAASQIKSGALYSEAQSEIAGWRKQIQGEVDRAQGIRYLQEAQQLARSGTPEGLMAAIQRADSVAPGSEARAEAENAMNQWSWQLLQIAQLRADAADVASAIAIAERIPANTEAYASAKQQIQTWKQAAAQPPGR